jgi:hypothetical protein
MDYTIENCSDLRKNKGLRNELNNWVHQQPDILLDNPPFDLLYANIKARANNSVPKPPSDPRRRPTTHRLDFIIFCGKNFLVDFIFSNECFPVNFILTTAAKDNQIGMNRGMKMGLTIGAAAGSSTSREDGTGFDVLAGGASFSARAPQTPRDNDAGDEEADDEEPPLDDAAIVTTLEG